MDNKLYTVKVQSNREKSLSERLKSELLRNEIEADIFIPLEKSYYLRNGKKTIKEKIIYPGYVFVETQRLGSLEELLKSIPGNTGIMKDRNGDPVVMKDRDLKKIKVDDVPEPVFDLYNYSVGESIKVIGGPFDKFSGVIKEIDKDRKKAKVDVSIFGRPTPVDLQFDQLEKVL